MSFHTADSSKKLGKEWSSHIKNKYSLSSSFHLTLKLIYTDTVGKI
jgi:hypothetical protein